MGVSVEHLNPIRHLSRTIGSDSRTLGLFQLRLLACNSDFGPEGRILSISTSGRATTTTQNDIWCNIKIILVLSRFCIVEWKRGFRCSIWWSTRWGSQLSSSRFGRSLFNENCPRIMYQGFCSKTFLNPPESWGASIPMIPSALFTQSPQYIKKNIARARGLAVWRSEIPSALLGIPRPALRGPLRNHFWKSSPPCRGREFWKCSGGFKCLGSQPFSQGELHEKL